jgi:NADPH2:quinone reductase
LREATRLAEAGKLAPRIDPRRFTFDAICHAYEAMKTGTAAGKIIVDTESVTSPK